MNHAKLILVLHSNIFFLGAKWLRTTVYERLCDKDSPSWRKNGSQLATFVVSAFWHGFYPGFYFSFVAFAFLNVLSQMGTKFVRPFFLRKDGSPNSLKPLYDFITWILVQTAFYYCANPFKQMSLQNVVATWNSVYWVFHLAGLGALLFYLLFGSLLLKLHPYKPSKVTENVDKKGNADKTKKE